MTKAILLCVATEKGYAVLRGMQEAELGVTLFVATFAEENMSVSFYDKICLYAKEHGISLCSWNEIKNEGVSWLDRHNIISIICVGWRYLVPQEMIKKLNNNVLVTHDSLLPRYRGFAPLATAMVNGDHKVGVTVLRASDEIDAGDILYQKSVEVGIYDKISDVIVKLLPLFAEGVLQSVADLLNGRLAGIPQDHSKATYSIWRDENDLMIDWADSAQRIERMIRALGEPYMGAHTSLNGAEVVIHSAKIVDDLVFEIRQPGKVWCLTSMGLPIVICGEGMLLIESATMAGRSILPMTKMRTRFGW